jgi:hypothetical protein
MLVSMSCLRQHLLDLICLWLVAGSPSASSSARGPEFSRSITCFPKSGHGSPRVPACTLSVSTASQTLPFQTWTVSPRPPKPGEVLVPLAPRRLHTSRLNWQLKDHDHECMIADVLICRFAESWSGVSRSEIVLTVMYVVG